jgi:thiamine biosynthesis protein ThiS
MEITLNGQARTVPGACTLNDLLAMQSVEPAHVVVEINRTIVPKDAYGALWIGPGDHVEILRFVGGG